MCYCCCFIIIITNIVIIIIVVIWGSGLDASTDTTTATAGNTTDSNTGTVGAGVVDGTSDVATASTDNNNKDPNWDTLDQRVAVGVAKKSQKLREQGNYFSFVLDHVIIIIMFYFIIFTFNFFIYVFVMQRLRKIKNWEWGIMWDVAMTTARGLKKLVC